MGIFAAFAARREAANRKAAAANKDIAVRAAHCAAIDIEVLDTREPIFPGEPCEALETWRELLVEEQAAWHAAAEADSHVLRVDTAGLDEACRASETAHAEARCAHRRTEYFVSRHA
jgi:hypothetical protein